MRLMTLFVTALFMATPAMAAPLTEGWSGEGSFSAGTSTGKTETTDLGLGLDLNRESGRWVVGVDAKADFGESDGVENKNRLYLAGKVDYQLRDKLFTFGQASYEKDEFSGFEGRYFLGGGLGYNIYEGDKLNWSIRGGPGIKVDEVREVQTAGVVTTPGETVESFSVIGDSDFSYQFNDNVGFSNETSMLYAEESTQLTNSTAMTASLTDTLSARVSFDVRHDTNPPAGFEETDTVTRVSLVYKFGS